MLKSWWVYAVFLLGLEVLRADPSFFAPTLNDVSKLSDLQRVALKTAEKNLSSDFYIQRWNYSGSSYYITSAAKEQLTVLASLLISLSSEHDEIIFVGRSPTGLLAFLLGYQSKHSTVTTRLRDLPFSFSRSFSESGGATTLEERTALRKYLGAQGLSPEKIAKSAKPILLMDFVYSGEGVLRLLDEISIWAKELNLADKVKQKLSFFGAYSGYFIMRESLQRLWRETKKDARGLKIDPPPQPTETEIYTAAKRVELPLALEFKKRCERVYSVNTSEKMYLYAGNLTYNIQQSFTSDKWIANPLIERIPIDWSQSGAAEFYYLFTQGESFFSFLLCCFNHF